MLRTRAFRIIRQDHYSLSSMIWLIFISVCRSFICPDSFETSCNFNHSAYICTEQNLSDIPLGIDTSIVCLDLGGNTLTSLADDSLTNFEYLKHLDLSKNQISFVSNSSLSSLEQLEFLDLSNNKLSSLPPGFFDKNTILKHVILSVNKLKSTPRVMFDNYAQLVEFTCERCFDCTCLHQDATSWIISNVWYPGSNEIHQTERPSCIDGTLLSDELQMATCPPPKQDHMHFYNNLYASNSTCLCSETVNDVTGTTETHTTWKTRSHDRIHGNTEGKATPTGIVAVCVMSVLSLTISTLTIVNLLRNSAKVISIHHKENGIENEVNNYLEEEIDFSFEFGDNDDLTINTPPLNHMVEANYLLKFTSKTTSCEGLALNIVYKKV